MLCAAMAAFAAATPAPAQHVLYDPLLRPQPALTVPQMGPAEAVWIKVLNPKPASSPAVTSKKGGKKS
jgi:hypothetical protein